jgi:hypothetical protein
MPKFNVEVRERLTVTRRVQIEAAEWGEDAKREARKAATSGPCDSIEVTGRDIASWSEVVPQVPEKARFRVTLREARTFIVTVEATDRTDALIVALGSLTDQTEPDTASIDLEDSEVDYIGGLA